ncbi:hypothetical protein AAVH_36404, partial [Aphelenchoides avenae]
FTMLEMICQVMKVIYYAILSFNLSTPFIDWAVYYVLSLQALTPPIVLLTI